MFDTVKVGRIISQKRKEHNMTQMQLADALGISFQAVSNWERGNSMPDISKLPELAELFGCSIEELLGGGRSAGNVEKMTKGEDLSLGELADIAPVLPPDVLDKAAASALSEDGDDDEAETDEEPEDFDEPDDEDAEDEDEDNDEDDDDDAPMRARWWRGREGADAYIARGGKKPRFFIFKSGKTGDKKGDKRRSKRIRELVCLAPFLSEERLAELVKDLQDDGFTVSELIPLAPFLSEEDLDALARGAGALLIAGDAQKARRTRRRQERAARCPRSVFIAGSARGTRLKGARARRAHPARAVSFPLRAGDRGDLKT